MIVALTVVTAETAVVGVLYHLSAPNPPGAAIYMLGVLAITILWGDRFGFLTALISTVAFNYFYVPPAGLHLTSLHDAVRLLLFTIAVMVGGALAGLARGNAEEARRRALEAETIARLTQLFLDNDLEQGLREASRCLEEQFGLRSAALVVAGPDQSGPAPGDIAIGIGDRAEPDALLLVPGDTPPDDCRRIRAWVGEPLAAMVSAALERDRLINSLRGSRARTEAVLAEQTALRRVATLVAMGGSPDRVFAAVTAELHRLFTDCRTALVRYEPNGEVFVASERDERGTLMPARRNQPISRYSIVGNVERLKRTVQVDYDTLPGPVAAEVRQLGVHRGIGVPVFVDGRLWGALLVLSSRVDPIPAGAQSRLQAFNELVATAIAVADNRAALAASRSRLVSAADDARRRIERDLHDGAQQRIISLALQLRLATDTVTSLAEAQRLLSNAVQGLTEIHQSLSDLARGIHPVLLAQGGLGPTIRMLARRSVVPCELDLDISRRLPEPVEVAIYYVVAEALTNIAKHSGASLACISVIADDRCVRVRVSDDGAGSADPARGTGLVGLRDRLEALGGGLSVASPPGGGTTLHAELPLVRPGMVSVPDDPRDRMATRGEGSGSRV
ncbi:DUF4118 domain-containing protein [Dactylosporangium vinaceum]|uniref:histidine kinase n=1 Tax=Dactylosporangium vinaceum TaxID=53362 RepID=A0ABV5M343_9ACTN|nr:DUF4118 domain-containing protein [Dactylosporangium vinaceum]UAB99784.1 DUF4118 domain-containing protein [Dactylosporangium vinaceum]